MDVRRRHVPQKIRIGSRDDTRRFQLIDGPVFLLVVTKLLRPLNFDGRASLTCPPKDKNWQHPTIWILTLHLTVAPVTSNEKPRQRSCSFRARSPWNSGSHPFGQPESDCPKGFKVPNGLSSKTVQFVMDCLRSS